MTQIDLAARMDRPAQVINQIVGERKAITAETARGLEHVLSIPRHVWMNLQTNYELGRDRLAEEQRLEEDARELVSGLGQPAIREMIRRGWIAKEDSIGAQLAELLSFFGVQSVSGLDRTQTAAAFRVTPAARVEPWRLAAWMRRGEIIASSSDSPASFDRDAFARALHDLRAATRIEAPWPNLREHCASVGVSVVVIPALPKSGANGVTYWLGRDRPVIQLSLRNKRADIFWFTFFHEAAHILEGYRADAVIDLDEVPRDDEAEQAANHFAADLLIPPADWLSFVERDDTSRATIVEFARQIGVHSGIVVGRLQRERRIPNSFHNDLHVKLDDATFEDSSAWVSSTPP